jgi:hypothetical protein
MILCAAEFAASRGGLTRDYLFKMAARYGAVVVIAWLTAIAIWPWLQVGNPLTQFKIAYTHFASIPMSFDLQHWGERIMTNDLPRTYIPGQLLARLPEAFLALLAVAVGYGIVAAVILVRRTTAGWRTDRATALRAAAMALGQERGILIVGAAVVLPLGFLIVQRATIYDGVRHVLFVIPMLAVLAGAGLYVLLPFLRRVPVLAATAAGAYAGGLIVTLVELHPLEYVAMNALAGGTRGAYGRFELDYWAVAATVAVRRLEERLDYDSSGRFAENPPSILICIPWREAVVQPLLERPWRIETDPQKAEFIIATERSRCAKGAPVVLVDEVKRFGRAFAWTYARPEIANGLATLGLATRPAAQTWSAAEEGAPPPDLR